MKSLFDCGDVAKSVEGSRGQVEAETCDRDVWEVETDLWKGVTQTSESV